METTMQMLWPEDMDSGNLDAWVAAIVAADRAGIGMVLLGAGDPADPMDGLSLAAFCASRTRAIRLCASVDPAAFEPFTLARGLATLDHLSNGRAAWRLAGPADEARTRELAEVTAKLLVSWGADALIEDRDAGLLSDSAKVHALGHEGTHFAVRGPLNLPQPPQGVPPRFVLPGDAAMAGATLICDAPVTLAAAQEAFA